jgi:hypothetical protein
MSRKAGITPEPIARGLEILPAATAPPGPRFFRWRGFVFIGAGNAEHVDDRAHVANRHMEGARKFIIIPAFVDPLPERGFAA